MVIMQGLADRAQAAAGMQIAPLAAESDGIRVPRHVGLAMLQHLPNVNQPVIVDPAERPLYFLVPVGATDSWKLPNRRILDVRRQIILPSAQRQMPLGRYWLTSPTWSARRAGPRLLRAALDGVWNSLLASRTETRPVSVIVGVYADGIRNTDVTAMRKWEPYVPRCPRPRVRKTSCCCEYELCSEGGQYFVLRQTADGGYEETARGLYSHAEKVFAELASQHFCTGRAS
ncbi:hypothetical protein ACTWPT_27350 [Nonomuraea sp. 3N208]|uniref:hypothetical protein n=1 Tax=Nonomuraea sp. 3N208 TaxID=3457421 RepID=UPI003FD20C02